MNSYYAEMFSRSPYGAVTYGYTFKDKNIREARLHALEVCKQLGAFPLPSVWRVSLEQHIKLREKFTLPRAIRIDGSPVDEAA